MIHIPGRYIVTVASLEHYTVPCVPLGTLQLVVILHMMRRECHLRQPPLRPLQCLISGMEGAPPPIRTPGDDFAPRTRVPVPVVRDQSDAVAGGVGGAKCATCILGAEAVPPIATFLVGTHTGRQSARQAGSCCISGKCVTQPHNNFSAGSDFSEAISLVISQSGRHASSESGQSV
jgi:hypothetical protein